MKLNSIAAASLLALSGVAMAGEQLTANEMDGVTAGTAAGLVFALQALGTTTAVTAITGTTTTLQLAAPVTVQLTSIVFTGSGIAAEGGSFAE